MPNWSRSPKKSNSREQLLNLRHLNQPSTVTTSLVIRPDGSTTYALVPSRSRARFGKAEPERGCANPVHQSAQQSSEMAAGCFTDAPDVTVFTHLGQRAFSIRLLATWCGPM